MAAIKNNVSLIETLMIKYSNATECFVLAWLSTITADPMFVAKNITIERYTATLNGFLKKKKGEMFLSIVNYKI